MDEQLGHGAAYEHDGADSSSVTSRVNAGSRWDPEDKRRYLEWEPRPDRFDEPAFIEAKSWFRRLTASEDVNVGGDRREDRPTEKAIATREAA